MDLPVHDDILWHACVLASRRLDGASRIGDPRLAFPFLVRGSWMNDTNQVSPFLEKNKTVDLSLEQKALFRGLWKLSLEELFDQARTRTDGFVLMTEQKKLMERDPENTDGFGVYLRHDHLDIVADSPPAEYDAGWASDERGGRASTVHHTVDAHIKTRLMTSSIGQSPEARLDPRSLTVLGRALHTVADFFAHSNYVELLLWSLAWREVLGPDLVDAFNHREATVDAGRPLLRCPLPGPKQDRSTLLGDSIMWYGPDPESTPLVSSLFDLKDTTFSLLHIYAAHLERTDGAPQSDAMLDIAMAVFDVQGQKWIKGAWKLVNTVQQAFSAVGRAARKVLADGIELLAKTQAGAASDLLEATAMLVRKYDSKEAGDWARAGKLHYVGRTLQMELAAQLAGQRPDQPRLPHHSLLAKDHVTDDLGGVLRFKLACLLATEVSADLLAWHFTKGEVTRDRWLANAQKRLVHPWRYVSSGIDVDNLAARVRATDGTARWQRQMLSGLAVFGGTAGGNP
jgi:hypothetical protein